MVVGLDGVTGVPVALHVKKGKRKEPGRVLIQLHNGMGSHVKARRRKYKNALRLNTALLMVAGVIFLIGVTAANLAKKD